MSRRLQSSTPDLRHWHEPRKNTHRPEFINRHFRHYIRAYGLRALLVARDGERAFISSSRDPNVAMKGLRIQYGFGLAPHRIWWGQPDGIIAVHLTWSATSQQLDATVLGLVEWARDRNIALTPDHVVRARARDLIERISLEVDHLYRTGQMRELKQAFATERRRQPSLQYDTFLEKLKILLLYGLVKERTR
jgi:hypothetical protein